MVSGDGVLQVALSSEGVLQVALLIRNSTPPQDHCRALGIESYCRVLGRRAMAGYKKKTGMYNGRLEDGVVSGDGILQVAVYSHGVLQVMRPHASYPVYI